MKKMIKTSTKLLSFMLALFLALSYCISVSGEYYMDSHPHAVNEGLTSAQVEKKDLESFKNTSGYDYHNSTINDYAPNEIIVQISSAKNNATATISSIKNEYNLYSGSILRSQEVLGENETKTSSTNNDNYIYTCHFMTGEDDIISLCDRLNEEEAVFNAEPNFKYYACDDTSVDMAADANATSYTEPTAFSTTGYTDHLKWWFDYCNISSAWETYADSSTGNGMGKGVTVAVIDTGCNTAHEDIKANLWSHPSNSNYCGYYAYQSRITNSDVYVTKNGQFDQQGHGSHCCGIIAMNGDNTVGGIGTAPKSKIMVMKADRGDGTKVFYGDEIILSLQKSKEFGADIISMSLGGYNFSYSLYQTYQEVSSSCVIVCAAGNDSFDTTEKLHFPSAASCNIGVMAMSDSKTNPTLARFSNYDTTGNFYKVAAPGTTIYSLDYSGNNLYKDNDGTSMATPAVAGMLASYMSYIKNVKGYTWSPAQYQYRIESTLNLTSNSLEIGAMSATLHSVAYELGSKFKVCNLKQLISSGSYSFSTPSATSFNNTTIRNGVMNATGLSASEINTYVLKRVSLLYWGDNTDSTRKPISDYSDLSKITGLNYLDLSGSTGVKQSNLETVISACPATLVYLDLRTSASLTDISCIGTSNFPCMHLLNISGNSIENIGSIAKLTSLKYLYAQNNKIKDISALSGMTHLEKIDLSNNLIEDPNPAFASKFLIDINLSNNRLSDYTQLYNFKGGYALSPNSHVFCSDTHTVTINVSSNYMSNLTQSIVDNIKSTIIANNTKNGTAYTETVDFTWSGQSTATMVPMTSFKISDKIVTDSADNSITREAFCSGNLNLNSITGFTAYPSNANQYKYLTWSCSEEGYCAPDGTILVTPDQITSTRTLSFTGTAPEASNATYTGTNDVSKTIKITITAPEIYNAYLSERVAPTGTSVWINVATNKYASSLVLRSGTGASATTYATYDLTNAVNKNLLANDECYQYMFSLPSSITGTTGTYSLYLFGADSTGAYTTSVSADVSGNTAYGYKNIGPLYIKDSVAYSSEVEITADKSVNRYGQAAIYAVNAGTSSTSPARISGTYGFTFSTFRYIGSGSSYTAYATGFNGNTNSSYPSKTTGKTTITLKIDGSAVNTAEINTVAPEVTNVSVRNKSSYKTDGYIEYLVKTNTDTTGIKAVNPLTSEEKENIDVDHILTTTGSATGTYGVYNSSYCYKLWVMRVPLKSNKSIDDATIVAYDPIGDGSVTKTPATSIKASPNKYIYIDSTSNYRNFSTDLLFYPVDADGNSLADCCKSVTFSIPQTDNFYINSETSGLVYCNYANIIQSTTSDYASAKVTVTLETGASAYSYLRAYLPYTDSVSYDADKSILTTGGTVYYTAKTYGIDTLYIKNDSSQYTEPAQVLTLDDTDSYTTGVDDNNNKYTLWNFERKFDDSNPLKTYLRGSYDYSGTTVNTPNYKYASVYKAYNLGDYSAWNEQLARIDESTLASAREAYPDTDDFEVKQALLNDYIDNANMFYGEADQTLIDEQTLELKGLIDNLYGYDAYNEAMERYNTVVSQGIYYIPEELTTLAQTAFNDSNVKDLANRISNYLDNLELLADLTQWNEALASIPENYSEVFTEGENHFVYLKADIDAIDVLKQIQFVEPLPASMQSQIDTATENLTTALANLKANKMDVTALVNLLNDKEQYTQKLRNYTLPDNLGGQYLAKINAIDFFALTSQEDVSLIYNEINDITSAIDEFCAAVDELYEYVGFLESNVKGITESKPSSPYYSDETYSPLKAKYDEVKQKLDNNNASYTSLLALTDDLAELQSLYSALHTHNFVLTVAETCTYKYMQCECGELVKVPYEEGDGEHSHDLSRAVVKTVELCDGTEITIGFCTCTNCGAVEYIYGEEVLTSHEHNWVLKEEAQVSQEILDVSADLHSRKPTCTNSGANVYICAECGIPKSEDIAPLGHSFTGEWYVYSQPTETLEGEKRCKCERCDEYISESIPVLPPRAEVIIPFSAASDEARGITINAYPSGIKLPYADPIYSFTEQADELGYKITVDAENKTYSIRLPLNYNYDLVIQKDGYTSYAIYRLNIGTDDIDLREFELNGKKVMAVLYAGDFNADGKVNALDRIALAPYIGLATEEKDKIYDLDNNGVIDTTDKSLLLRDYMNSEQFTFLSEDN